METLDTYTDKELFARISEGNEKAFGEIFYRYTAKISPFLTNFLHGDLWTEEIIQDVFMKLWQKRERLTEVEHPAAYIYQIASNRALDYIKKNGRDIKLQYYLAQNQPATAVNQTESDVNYRLADALIKEAIHSLPPQRRKVYEMAREQGLSHDEISEILGISRHTVRNQVAEALQEIRLYLTEKGAFGAILLLAIKNLFGR